SWRSLARPSARLHAIAAKNDGQLQMARSIGCPMYPVPRADIAFGRSVEDVVDVSLWIAIVQRKPAALDLHHYPMPRCECMKHLRHADRVLLDLVRRNGLGLLEAVAV